MSVDCPLNAAWPEKVTSAPFGSRLIAPPPAHDATGKRPSRPSTGSGGCSRGRRRCRLTCSSGTYINSVDAINNDKCVCVCVAARVQGQRAPRPGAEDRRAAAASDRRRHRRRWEDCVGGFVISRRCLKGPVGNTVFNRLIGRDLESLHRACCLHDDSIRCSKSRLGPGFGAGCICNKVDRQGKTLCAQKKKKKKRTPLNLFMDRNWTNTSASCERSRTVRSRPTFWWSNSVLTTFPYAKRSRRGQVCFSAARSRSLSMSSPRRPYV